MGIFSDRSAVGSHRSTPGKTVQAEASPMEFIHYIDCEPVLEDLNHSSLLSGWALAQGDRPSADVYLEGTRIFSAPCSIPRADVLKSFPQHQGNLLCGFELDFPPGALQRLEAGLLEVRLQFGQHSTVVWRWQGALPGEARSDAARELRLHFSMLERTAQMMSEDSARRSSGIEGCSIHAVVSACSGRTGLRSILRRLSDFSSRDAEVESASGPILDSLTIVCANEVDKETISLLLPQFPQLPARVGTRSELCSWSSIAQPTGSAGASSAKQQLLLYFEDYAEIKHLELEELLQDFLELPAVPLLNAAVYGAGEYPLSGPLGVNLASLRESTLVRGADMPALARVEAAGPVWIASAEFLEAYEQQFGGGSSDLRLPSAKDGLQFYADLRHPVRVRHDVGAYTANEHEQLQFAAENELEIDPDASKRAPSVLLLLDTESVARGPVTAELRQLASFAEELCSLGIDVQLVEDASTAVRPYFGDLSVVSIDDVLTRQDSFETSGLESSWLIAGTWKCVRSASALRYRLRCSSAMLLQSLPPRVDSDALAEGRFSRRREDYDLHRWAAQAELLPIVFNPEVAEGLSASGLGFAELSSLGYKLAAQDFWTDQGPRSGSARSARGVLIVLGEDGRDKLKAASRLIAELQAKAGDVVLSIAGLSEIGAPVLSLLESVDHSYGELDAVSMADLLSLHSAVHSVVIDCSGGGAASPSAFEAVCCGAAVVHCSLDEDRGADRSQHSSISDAAEKAAALLDSAEERIALQQSGKHQFDALKRSLTPDFLGQLAAAEQAQVTQLAEVRSAKCGASVIIPVYCALDATVQCLRSVIATAPREFEIIVVNDVSDTGTTAALEEIAASSSRIKLINKSDNGGFVQSCLSGFAAANPDNDIILLNSDVVFNGGQPRIAAERLLQPPANRTCILSVDELSSPPN